MVQGGFGGTVIGSDEGKTEEGEWDAVGIVRYPSTEAFIALFADSEYRDGHHHRIAATEKHRMMVVVE